MSIIILPVFYHDIKVNQEHFTVFIVLLNIFKWSLIIIKNFDTLVPNCRNIKKKKCPLGCRYFKSNVGSKLR